MHFFFVKPLAYTYYVDKVKYIPITIIITIFVIIITSNRSYHEYHYHYHVDELMNLNCTVTPLRRGVSWN